MEGRIQNTNMKGGNQKIRESGGRISGTQSIRIEYRNQKCLFVFNSHKANVNIGNMTQIQ